MKGPILGSAISLKGLFFDRLNAETQVENMAGQLWLRLGVRIRKSSQLGGTHANKPNNVRSNLITIDFIINLSSHIKLLFNDFSAHNSLLIFNLYSGSELNIMTHFRG